MLRVFNTMSRQKEAFAPAGPVAKMYACGPSIYQLGHVGNYRTYVFEDVFKRLLKSRGWRVRHVMNITDVENKAIQEANRLGRDIWRLTRENERAVLSDLRRLNVIPADFNPRASENIPGIVRLIQRLDKKGFAYEEGGDWWFDVSKFPRYGRLSRLKTKIPAGRKIGAEEYPKSEAGDFILWRARKPSDGPVHWKTAIGDGRPGWSVECTAMAFRFLGETIDVKMGGVDNIFNHHENEIAQAEAATGKQFAKYWVHVKHLVINGGKMSKSLGNVVYLGDVEKMGFDPVALRLLYLQAHYRRVLDFSWERLRRAQKDLEGFRRCAGALKAAACRADGLKTASNAHFAGAVKLAATRFDAAMDDDLHTETAYAEMNSLSCLAAKLAGAKRRLSCADARLALDTLRGFDEILGLGAFGGTKRQ